MILIKGTTNSRVLVSIETEQSAVVNNIGLMTEISALPPHALIDGIIISNDELPAVMQVEAASSQPCRQKLKEVATEKNNHEVRQDF